jgi:ubiquinone/menaquinone biosynthesis C-methylase UbiE
MDHGKTPWDYMGPAETAILGDVVLNPEEQSRWARAILFGTLPYMWREKASVIREMIYDKLALKPGDKVLIIGECVKVCGFDADMQARMGGKGHIDIVDITDFARRAYIDGFVGRGGQLATWQWTYTKDTPDNHYDAVAVLQSVQHTDDWHESARELVRILKPGRSIVLAEISLGPNIMKAASIDVHIEACIDKIFSRMGWSIEKFPYYSAEQLHEAFAGVGEDAHAFVWKGIEIFWGRKPA